MNIIFALLLGLLIILVYILWGGLGSVIWTSCFQGSILIGGGLVLCMVLISYYFDSIGDLGNALIEKGSDMTINLGEGNYNIRNDLRQWMSYILLCSTGFICLPQIFPRMYMGKSIKVQKTTGITITLSAIWCMSFILIGMIASLNIAGDVSQTVLFTLVEMTGNIFLLSLTYIVIIASSMGTLDITLLSVVHARIQLSSMGIPSTRIGLFAMFIRGVPIIIIATT
ncbi:MAG: hypothetical protein PHG06_17640 [Parabacteroides sp.]|nr:hypothetical protein [Parabacteroides sp.]